jgi:hypothetical protein
MNISRASQYNVSTLFSNDYKLNLLDKLLSLKLINN